MSCRDYTSSTGREYVAMEQPNFAKIIVRFERRPDGGLRAYSDDVPGFVLSHSDPELVMKDVGPALAGIMSYLLGAEVTVNPLPTFAELLSKQDEVAAYTPPPQIQREYVGCIAA
jgi:hypothetical protein